MMNNNLLKVTITFFLMALLIVVSGCIFEEEKKEKEKSGIPEADQKDIGLLIEEGIAPLEISELTRKVFAPIPSFRFNITNISDTTIETFRGTAVFFDSEGNFMPEYVVDTSSADLILPGWVTEFTLITHSEDASTGEFILERVTYTASHNNMRFMKAWENLDFEAQYEEITGTAYIPPQESEESKEPSLPEKEVEKPYEEPEEGL